MVMGWSTNTIKQKIVSEEKGVSGLKRSKLVETF